MNSLQLDRLLPALIVGLFVALLLLPVLGGSTNGRLLFVPLIVLNVTYLIGLGFWIADNGFESLGRGYRHNSSFAYFFIFSAAWRAFRNTRASNESQRESRRD